MKSNLLKCMAVIAALIVAWLGWRALGTRPPERETGQPAAALERAPRVVFRNGRWERLHGQELEAFLRDLASRKPGLLRISGAVRDSDTGKVVPLAEVVFASELGESSTTAGDDGRYTIEIVPGFYRAFARAEGYVAVGMTELERLPGTPDASEIGLPRGELAPLVAVFRDQGGMDMLVRGSAEIVGTVYDGRGEPIAGAIVMGRLSGWRGSMTRLILGTDMDESDLDGSFRLEVPAGPIELTAVHHEFAGLADSRQVYLGAGETQRIDLTMSAGCIITGHVVDSRGQLVGDGSLEMWNGGAPPNDFYPVGKFTAGRFRLARTEAGRIKLRAWPWKSPPTVAREFSCEDGARHESVTFVVPDADPELEGSVWSQGGQPLARAYIDLFPLGPGGIAQQERADGYGEWAFYSVPAGTYRLIAHVPGFGIATSTVTAPSRGIKLRLGGTGAISGTVDGLQDGSFTFTIERCLARDEDGNPVLVDEFSMPRTSRLVAVENGTFHIDGLPACGLGAAIRTQSRTQHVHVNIEADRTVPLTLDLSQAALKTVYGVVMDQARASVSDVTVSRIPGPGAPVEPIAVTTTDTDGRYEIQAYAGDTLYFRGSQGWAEVTVGGADDAREERSVTLEE